MSAGPRPAWATWAGLGVLAVAAAGGATWLRGATYRLYLEKRIEARPGSARQRFVVSDGRIQPQIVAPGDERLAFGWGRPGAAELRYGVVAAAPATIEIIAIQHGQRRVLVQHPATASPDTRRLGLPDGMEALELANHGPVTWLDARFEQHARVWPSALALAALGAGALHVRRPLARRALLVALTTVISLGLAAGALEAGLRVFSPSLPWLAAARRDLGELQPDPRWREEAPYGTRLSPGLHTFCEWRYGDIVRLGYLPPELAPQGRLRFPLVTDADGFRNDDPPGPAPVAALGDSFTDALTVPAPLSWPARLQARLGRRVRNYGTAGFGPLQELEVLRRYVLPRRPRAVV
ncbi:MAG TPA: hypothetical protein VF310_03620, partial [Vicinamibacteria bacterium]